MIFLRPPEKLVIEIKSRGRVLFVQWTINGNIFDGAIGVNFAYHREIYVQEETTQADIGVYEVEVFPDLLSGGQLLLPADLEFIVTSPGNFVLIVMSIIPYSTIIIYVCIYYVFNVVDASTTANSEPVVTVVEGNSVTLSCTSTGAPTPTMTWELNGETTPFMQFDRTEATQARVVCDAMDNFVPDITVGSIVSDLTITNAQYPDHDGVYTCIGSNDEQMVTTSTSSITVVVVSK